MCRMRRGKLRNYYLECPEAYRQDHDTAQAKRDRGRPHDVRNCDEQHAFGLCKQKLDASRVRDPVPDSFGGHTRKVHSSQSTRHKHRPECNVSPNQVLTPHLQSAQPTS